MPAIEGYFIQTVDNLVFEVKGVLHPADRYVAYIRYVPRLEVGQSTLNKIYDLQARETYLGKYHPEYLWFSSVLGREVQSVPLNKVRAVLNPVEHLNLLRTENREISSLEEASLGLADILIENTGIKWTDVGVTGSQLVGTAGENSDIDLVVYGEAPCRKVYRNIAECFSVIPDMKRYSGEGLEQHLRFRWGGLVQYWWVLRDLERRKLLQGFYKGFEFFVKLVQLPEDLEYSYGDRTFKHIGDHALNTEVVDDRNSIFTPCIYDLDSDSSEVKSIASYRGRFAEHVHSGDRITVRGRLENVTDTRNGTSHLQVVLGESLGDYLLPL